MIRNSPQNLTSRENGDGEENLHSNVQPIFLQQLAIYSRGRCHTKIAGGRRSAPAETVVPAVLSCGEMMSEVKMYPRRRKQVSVTPIGGVGELWRSREAAATVFAVSYNLQVF